MTEPAMRRPSPEQRRPMTPEAWLTLVDELSVKYRAVCSAT